MCVKECGITVTHLLDIIRKSENEVITLLDALKNEQLKNVKADQTTHDLKKKLDSALAKIKLKDQELKKMNIIGKLSVRNVNKRIKMRDTSNRLKIFRS